MEQFQFVFILYEKAYGLSGSISSEDGKLIVLDRNLINYL